MEESSLKLEVITPERIVYSSDIDFVVVPAVEGELGVLKNHAPLVAGLQIGVLRLHRGGLTRHIALGGGFLEVTDNRAIVLAESAELGTDIDVSRALAAKERAEARLAARSPEINEARAQASLQRALARLKAAEAEKNLGLQYQQPQRFGNE
ncbi:MAG: F0F1 ATP synthase subunit epsilon [Firmicutes bacterium]|nr:F0F1 ATP synthase subunit epsilon [Bacillota bacterium]